MEVLGSAVGVASLGIQVCQGLLTYYNGWKDYGADTANVRDAVLDLHETLALLKDTIEAGGLDDRRSQRVAGCMKSCNGDLAKLSTKLEQLQKYDKPEGWRQKARSETQRLWYPFRKDTLAKLRANVSDVRGRLQFALQVLQLDASRHEQYKIISTWLHPPDPWTNHDSARQRHEAQTGTWLLDCPQYTKWKTGSERHVWMYGKAGCGKTVLCSTAVEDIFLHLGTLTNAGLAFFYFTFSDDHKQSLDNLLRSLVFQLGLKEPGLSMLQQACSRSNRSAPGRDELENILAASTAAYDEVFVILDALDESPEESEVQQTLLEGIERLAQRSPNLRVLATSRELREIRELMDTLQCDQIAIATQAVDVDIKKYVSTQLIQDRALRRLDSESRALVETTIAQKSDGMFRWAYCQLQELKKLKSYRPSFVLKALERLPNTLDETYARMLTNIDEMYRNDALKLLGWIVYAQSPLSLGELVEVAIINAEEEYVAFDDRGDLESTLTILSGLVTAVGQEKAVGLGDDSFVFRKDSDEDLNRTDDLVDDRAFSVVTARIDKNTRVRLAHFSVKEYLQSSQILQDDAKLFHLEPAREHRHLAQDCLTYIISYSRSEERMNPKQDLTTFPLLKYASRSWHHHSRLQQPGPVALELSLLTSEDLRRCWLQVYNLDYPWNPADFNADVAGALYCASCVGSMALVKALIDGGANVNTHEGYDGNPLQAATSRGREQIVALLLDYGAAVNAQDRGPHGNALEMASAYGHDNIVAILLAHGAEVNAQGGQFGNALQAAAFNGHEKIVASLLEHGADVHAQGGSLGNALTAACYGRNEKIVGTLLALGADVNAQGGPLRNALQTASWAGSKDIVAMLLDRGAEINAQGGRYGNALQAALHDGSQETVMMLLDRGAEINAQGGAYGNALQAASLSGSEEIVTMLLDRGAEINAQGGAYGNALQAASFSGSEEIVTMLLERGADVNAEGGEYGTALQAALATEENEEVVALLLDHGAIPTNDFDGAHDETVILIPSDTSTS